MPLGDQTATGPHGVLFVAARTRYSGVQFMPVTGTSGFHRDVPAESRSLGIRSEIRVALDLGRTARRDAGRGEGVEDGDGLIQRPPATTRG